MNQSIVDAGLGCSKTRAKALDDDYLHWVAVGNLTGAVVLQVLGFFMMLSLKSSRSSMKLLYRFFSTLAPRENSVVKSIVQIIDKFLPGQEIGLKIRPNRHCKCLYS